MQIIVKPDRTSGLFVVRPERIEAAVRGAESEAASRPEKGELREMEGHVAFRFPRELVVNAVAGHGESLEDDGYWEDMARRVPACRVKYKPRKTQVGSRGGEVHGDRVVTRFGVGRRFRYG
jgi:hypothetical protein